MMDRNEVVSGLERTLEAYETAGPGAYTCRVEPRLIRAALDCLRETPARLLTWEEIRDLPEGAVVWEECVYAGRPFVEPDEEDALPVVKIGNRLIGGDGYMPIDMDKFHSADTSATTVDEDGNIVLYRWWSARPTISQMEEAAWLSGTR